MASHTAVIDDVRSQMGRDGKRAAQKTVLDARQRLTSSSGTRASYDFELMHDYAGARIAAALPMAAIVAILSIVSSFWVPVVFTLLWAGMVLLTLAVVVLIARRFKRTDPSKFNAEQWTTSFVIGETLYGLSWRCSPWLPAPRR
jgi:two-component system cell cycle sensor histidine kinase PleC